MGELLPTRGRGVAAAWVNATNNLAAFVITATFASLVSSVGSDGAFAVYASVCAASVGYTFGLLPESRGKSFEAVAAAFNRPAWEAAPVEERDAGGAKGV